MKWLPMCCSLPGTRAAAEPAAHDGRAESRCPGFGVPSCSPCQQVLLLPGMPRCCWPASVLLRSPNGAKSPQCQGSASQSREVSSAPQSQAGGTVTTTQHCAQHRGSLHWEVLLDAAPDCSAYIHWLLIALKIFKD